MPMGREGGLAVSLGRVGGWKEGQRRDGYRSESRSLLWTLTLLLVHVPTVADVYIYKTAHHRADLGRGVNLHGVTTCLLRA